MIESVLKIEIEEYMKEINTNYDKIRAIINGYLPERSLGLKNLGSKNTRNGENEIYQLKDISH